MKPLLLLQLVFVILFAGSCTKNSEDFSETKALLQHKWTQISITYIVPDKPTLNGTIKLGAGYYYDFKTNDTLEMTTNATTGNPPQPYYTKVKYTLRSPTVYTIGPGTPLRMLTLTDDLLVLQQPINYTIQTSRGNVSYRGTMIDTLRR